MKARSLIALLVLLTAPPVAAGTIDTTQFYSPILDDTLGIAVYLPDGYDDEPTLRYPVIYFLAHGEDHLADVFTLRTALDDLIAAGMIDPVIVAFPNDGDGPFGTHLWANSKLYGRHQDYVAEDVVDFMDVNYRTIPGREWRSLMGTGDGGDGAFVMGLQRWDVFSALAAHEAWSKYELALDLIRSGVLAEVAGQVPPYVFQPSGFWQTAMYRTSGAYSPNLANPPYFVDLPLDENADVVPEVLDRWMEYNAEVLAAVLPPELEPSIFFGCGQDSWSFPILDGLSTALDAQGTPHTFVAFSGGFNLNNNRARRMLRYLNNHMYGPTTSVEIGVAGGAGVRLQPNTPNPFVRSTTVAFDLPTAMTGEVSIYSVDGRRVAVLGAGLFEAGRHEIRWSGTDQAGRPLPSGVYFYRLRAGEHVDTRRMTLLR